MGYSTPVIAVNWYGPFSSIQKAGAEAREGGVLEGLYLAVNRCDEAYVGVSADVFGRLKKGHHVLGTLEDEEADIWVGAVSSQTVPKKGAGATTHSLPVKTAERALAFFLELSENKQLRAAPPSSSFILINRWFDSQSPYSRLFRRGHKNWPDVIEYDSELGEAQLVWYGKQHKILDGSEIAEMTKSYIG